MGFSNICDGQMCFGSILIMLMMLLQIFMCCAVLLVVYLVGFSYFRLKFDKYVYLHANWFLT